MCLQPANLRPASSRRALARSPLLSASIYVPVIRIVTGFTYRGLVPYKITPIPGVLKSFVGTRKRRTPHNLSLAIRGELLLIISVHLPKTAGTSFAATLERNFGTALLRDYADIPINTQQYERNKLALQSCLSNAENDFQDIKCIHGHFLPIKYLLLSDRRHITFVTWLRSPVERVLSHYHFWQRSFNPENAPPLQRKMMEEKWSLERFCLGPEVRNLYFQFLYGFPLEYFSFIGITEFYDDDFAFFVSHFMDSYLEPERLNVGKTVADYQISESLRNEIEQHHSKDMNLYQRALEIRLTLRSPPVVKK